MAEFRRTWASAISRATANGAAMDMNRAARRKLPFGPVCAPIERWTRPV